MKVLSGTSNLKLSEEIAKHLKLKLVNSNIRRFSDGEVYVEINEKVCPIAKRFIAFRTTTGTPVLCHPRSPERPPDENRNVDGILESSHSLAAN